ncbi:MAG: hypothetical protein ACOX2U_07605 [Limisphaerales bacterium]|nr:hypothetical protein [Verrucomicrobiota bacterium]
MNWNIQTRSRFCSKCQEEFLDRQAYQTTLFSRADGSYWREDVCMKCKIKPPTPDRVEEEGHFVSQWQGVFQQTMPPAQDKALESDEVEELLRRIVALNNPSYVNAAYILAVMLERKRALKVKEVFYNKERKLTVYEQPKTGDIFTIEDPLLEINQLEEVQRQVCQLLETGGSLETDLFSKNETFQTEAQELLDCQGS